jgi:hypothetical protein
MKEYYLLGKTQSLHNKIATFAQYPTETILKAFECFKEYTRAVPHHKFTRRISFKSSIKDLPWRQGRSSMHRWEDPSSSLRRSKLSLYSRRSQTMTRGRHRRLLSVQPIANVKGVLQVDKEDILKGKTDLLMWRFEKMEIEKKEA